jgi:hypothetical protein
MSFWLKKLGWFVEESSLAHILSVILTLFRVDVTLCCQNKFWSHAKCKGNIRQAENNFLDILYKNPNSESTQDSFFADMQILTLVETTSRKKNQLSFPFY